MKTASVLKVFKSGEYPYIYIYYKLGANLLRVNTGNKVIKSHMRADGYFKKSMKDSERLNDETKELKSKVDSYIRTKLQLPKPTVNQKECQSFINGEFIGQNDTTDSQVVEVKTVIDYFKEFYTFKERELNHYVSVKDYLTLQNALTDYQTNKKAVLTFDNLNTIDFMIDFREFLSDTHADCTTKGGLNDNTINKRFSCLKTFMRYIESKEIYNFKKASYDFKTAKYENDIVALTKAEIQQIIDIKTENEAWQQIIDLFVFNCFCGLRYSDLVKLKRSNYVQDEEGDWFIIQENKKTGIKVQIDLQKTSLAILKKYDFKLPVVCSQYFNRKIKDILEKFELLGETVTKKRRSLKENKDFETVKRDLISSHTGRRTFITLCVSENVPLNSIMLASGHTKLATVKKYMKLQPNKKAFSAIDL